MGFTYLMVDFTGKNVLICGGGRVALRKAKKFLKADARVKAVSLEFDDEFYSLALDLVEKPIEKSDLEGADLVVGATDSKEVNFKVGTWARDLNILHNIADGKSMSDVYLPMEFKSAGLDIGLSSAGRAPFILEKIKEDIKEATKEWSENRLELLGFLRRRAIESGMTEEEKTLYYQKLIEMTESELENEKVNK